MAINTDRDTVGRDRLRRWALRLAYATIEGREAWHDETDDCCTPPLGERPDQPVDIPQPIRPQDR